MKAGMSSTPIATLDLILDALHDQGDGTWTAEQAAGVISVQPDGTIQHRPPATAGAWERCTKTDKTLTYCPEGTKAFVFAYAVGLVNT